MPNPQVRIEPPYNPLAKENLGKSVADALLEREIGRLPPPEKFIAAGVYAIYYHGPFKVRRWLKRIGPPPRTSAPKRRFISARPFPLVPANGDSALARAPAWFCTAV